MAIEIVDIWPLNMVMFQFAMFPYQSVTIDLIYGTLGILQKRWF